MHAYHVLPLNQLGNLYTQFVIKRKKCLGNHHVKHVMYKSHVSRIIHIPKNAIPSSNNLIINNDNFSLSYTNGERKKLPFY